MASSAEVASRTQQQSTDGDRLIVKSKQRRSVLALAAAGYFHLFNVFAIR